MKLRINLATRRYIDHRMVNGILGGAFLVCLLLLAFQLNRTAYLAGEVRRARGEAAALAKTGKVEVVNESQYRVVKARIAFANTVLERKGLNWLGLLDALEATVPEGVALNRIEPNPHDNLIKIGGAARNFTNLRQLMENMEHSPYFSEVYILSQSEAKVGLTQQGILFGLSTRVNLR
ncbi:PilN domain-containing protein [Geomesophilobacter sediminis]|uniref:PilN domain-containing protein n=1 Tax=Geomesophilobacter sediminis TaxID=2798584 RepID=A0A8J7LZF5_9BACT|nr:PilN domain-containing protein [Geomesophilobacter sediminis]MBJ6726331.1 PilN domain-containing protein [Geomesophilobacter sediminis]